MKKQSLPIWAILLILAVLIAGTVALNIANNRMNDRNVHIEKDEDGH